MTNDEIRKLLGGYATNTLTEGERKVLFDAALEDQELFNALQDEEALKDLLADPVSRAQLQRALDQPARQKAAWWNRRWAWTGAASVVAAVVLIVGVVRMNAPSNKERHYLADTAKAPTTPPVAVQDKEKAAEPATAKQVIPNVVAQQPPAPKPVPEDDRKSAGRLARGERKAPSMTATRPDSRPGPAGVGGAQNEKKDELASTPPPGNRALDSVIVGGVAPALPRGAPAANQQINVQTQAPQGGPSQNAAQNQNVVIQNPAIPNPSTQTQYRDAEGNATSARLASQLAEMRSLGKTAFLRYSLVKRENSGAYAPVPANDGLKAGDEVRLNVTPVASGLLSLDRLDASGTAVRVFPASGPGLAVVANTGYTIPNSPIEVQDTDQKFRLNLLSQVAQSVTVIEAAPAGKLKQSPSKARSLPPQSPMQRGTVAPSVEITIGPKRTP